MKFYQVEIISGGKQNWLFKPWPWKRSAAGSWILSGLHQLARGCRQKKVMKKKIKLLASRSNDQPWFWRCQVTRPMSNAQWKAVSWLASFLDSPFVGKGDYLSQCDLFCQNYNLPVFIREERTSSTTSTTVRSSTTRSTGERQTRRPRRQRGQTFRYWLIFFNEDKYQLEDIDWLIFFRIM